MDILTFARSDVYLSHEYESKLEKLLLSNGVLHINGRSYITKISDLEKLEKLGDVKCGSAVKMLHKPSGIDIAVKYLRYRSDEIEKILDDLYIIEESRDCPYLVEYYGCVITDTEVWICMELMTTCLKKVLTAEKCMISEDFLGKLTVIVVEALLFLKKKHGIIHGNVRPSNILVDKKGGIKLCGCWSKNIPRTRRGEKIEKFEYLAPEIIAPKDTMKPVCDIRSDFWSLGITLMELATKRYPYGNYKTEFELLSTVVEKQPPILPNDAPFSSEFRDFVSCCLAKDYDERPTCDKLIKHPFYQKYENFDKNTTSYVYFSGLIKFCCDWLQVFRLKLTTAKGKIANLFRLLRQNTAGKPKNVLKKSRIK